VSQQPVLVAGAGIAGLTTAIGLAQTGLPVILLERSDLDNEVGAGLQLGPNAVRALQKLGAWEAVVPIVYTPPEIQVRDGRSGHLLQSVDLGKSFVKRYGTPYCLALRKDLHAALLDVARHHPLISIWDNCDVKDVVESDVGVKVNNTVQGLCLIAADGVHSRIRQTIFPDSRTRALRHSIFRSLEPMPDRLPGVNLDCVNLWLCDGGHVVHYPAGREHQLNIVVVADRQIKHPYSAFALVHEPLARVLGSAQQYLTWPALAVPELPTWHRGKICLTGDAAHGTVPFLAQGAAMAIEDAVAMQSAVLKSSTVEAAFAAFTAQRIKRTAKLDRQSRRLAKLYHASGILAAARNTIMRTNAIHALATVDWIYSH
jgi:salicylate hydroxylase